MTNGNLARQGGQSMTEYTVLLLFVVVALITSTMEPSPIADLVDALKRAYTAFSFVISFSV
jgi:Flp pilus assembly pilin Flp